MAAGLHEVVAFQADACRSAGSPLYGWLLDAVTADLDSGGPTAEVLRADRHDDPLASALPLRLLGAVHRLVLGGQAPELAAHYPSAGGRPGEPEELAAAFRRAVERHRDDLVAHLADPVQTNEVGRAAVLVGGLALVAATHRLPLRVLEMGASAGLNLRFDHYWYDTGRTTYGDPASPVRFDGVWQGAAAPDLSGGITVCERRGCDTNPVDPSSPEGRLTLRSFVWPDQLDRLARLDAALEVALRVPARVDRADGPGWLARRLAEREAGVATVVVHSIVLQYLERPARRRLRATIEAAGERAGPRSPLAWLRMEPAGEHADLRLTSWPGGDERQLATAGYHGQPISWLA